MRPGADRTQTKVVTVKKAEIDQIRSDLLRGEKMIIPERAVSGLNLVYHSDLVVTG
jgi:hypothetical protein